MYASSKVDRLLNFFPIFREMTEDDLLDVGVDDPEHCQIILEYIQSLPL